MTFCGSPRKPSVGEDQNLILLSCRGLFTCAKGTGCICQHWAKESGRGLIWLVAESYQSSLTSGKTTLLPSSSQRLCNATAPHAENEQQLPCAAGHASSSLQVASWNKGKAPLHFLRTCTVRHWLVSTENWVLSALLKVKSTVTKSDS